MEHFFCASMLLCAVLRMFKNRSRKDDRMRASVACSLGQAWRQRVFNFRRHRGEQYENDLYISKTKHYPQSCVTFQLTCNKFSPHAFWFFPTQTIVCIDFLDSGKIQ